MKPKYSKRDVQEAFEEWQNTGPEFLARRQMFWDRYVDRRDNLEEGTTERRRCEGQGSQAEVTENEEVA